MINSKVIFKSIETKTILVKEIFRHEWVKNLCKFIGENPWENLRLVNNKEPFLTLTSESRSRMKSCMVAVFEVPVSPTRRTGCLLLTMSSRSQRVRTVSTVGTRISLNFLSGSWTYLGTFFVHWIHLVCSPSQKYSNIVGAVSGISPRNMNEIIVGCKKLFIWNTTCNKFLLKNSFFLLKPFFISVLIIDLKSVKCFSCNILVCQVMALETILHSVWCEPTHANKLWSNKTYFTCSMAHLKSNLFITKVPTIMT